MEARHRVIVAGRFESTKMSETSGAIHQLMRRHITEKRETQMHRCERPYLANIYNFFFEMRAQKHIDKSDEIK
jgi:hypothetical protein